MNQQRFQRSRTIVFLAVWLSFTLLAAAANWSLSAASASNVRQSMNGLSTVADSANVVSVAVDSTDVISVALEESKLRGLVGDPEQISIVHGALSNFSLPGDEFPAERTVWLAWIKGTFFLNWPGADNRPANNLYVFIDADTGQAFQFLGAMSPIDQFNPKAWINVSKNDIGKFPIPKFVRSGGNAGVAPQRPTPTPVK
jgi:hypothetical protein